MGLGDRDDEAEFYIPVYNGRVMSGLSSFDYHSAKTWLDETNVIGFQPDRLEMRVERAPIRKLDDYNLNPDLIKIDVQGLEEQVVRGGMETIDRARPVLFIENPSPELVSMLGSRGYRVFECHFKRLVASTGTSTNQYFLPS